MPISTITSKGQLTVPGSIRKALKLRPGDRVIFYLRDDGIVEMQSESVDLMSLFGALTPRESGVTLDDMDAAIEQGALGLDCD